MYRLYIEECTIYVSMKSDNTDKLLKQKSRYFQYFYSNPYLLCYIYNFRNVFMKYLKFFNGVSLYQEALGFIKFMISTDM